VILKPSPVLPPLPPEEYEALRDHIARNGVEEPILVTASGEIIDGNERYRALTELGLRKYPIRVVGNLTDVERREMAIALNLLRPGRARSARRNSSCEP
jgi:ParB-like chromosome segregation protein Spo0J